MHTLKVGDVLSSSWGYEQTNVTFYQVTRVTKASIELGVLRSKETSDGELSMTGYKVPVVGEFVIGTDRFMKRVSTLQSGKPSVRISSYEYEIGRAHV